MAVFRAGVFADYAEQAGNSHLGHAALRALGGPFLIGKPPPELLHALGSWLGSEAVQAKLILFMWVDAAMNKFAVILGPALAGGIIAEERARGTLDLTFPWRIAGFDASDFVALSPCMCSPGSLPLPFRRRWRCFSNAS